MDIRYPFKALRRAWTNFQKTRRMQQQSALIALAGQMLAVPNPRAVDDGVDYGQPVLMPRWARQAWRGWTPEKQAAYLSESDRTSFRFQFDTPQRGSLDDPVSMPHDDPLAEWDAATRRSVLENTHAAYERNPIAKAGVDYTGSFVVGRGMIRTYRNQAVKKIIEAFCESPDNPVDELEKSLITDIQQDGELFLRFFEDAGTVAMVPQRPWECTAIDTAPGFFRRVKSYTFKHESEPSEEVDAADIIHVAVNRRSYELRGRPDLFVILPWLKAYKDWLEDRARQNYWRNALLFFLAVETNNSAVIANVAQRWKQPPAPGSVAVESSKVSLNAVSNPTGAGEVGEDGRAMKLMAAMGLRLPEYFLADGENANLASTNNQELPALTKFSDYQGLMIGRVWQPVFKRVLQAALDANMLGGVAMRDDEGEWVVPEEDGDGQPVYEPGEVPGTDGPQRMVPLMDAFGVSYEPLQQSDPKDMAEMLDIAARNGWVSDTTASTELGYDWQKEQKLIDREQQEAMAKMAGGMMPMPPGMVPDGLADDGADEEEPEGVADAV
jgi:hypothetical protein